jgi:phage/plasmid-associated DNA primase
MRIIGSYGTVGSTTLFMKKNDKRPFELGDIAHARALFVPETLKGMTWDDALICSMLGGVPVRVDRKYRDSRHVRIFMSITITGNHLPQFITSSQPNKSGIDRRLLLLKVDKLLQGKIDDHYARKLVAEEGRAILMWFIQHAMEGYQSLQSDGSFYGKTVKKAKAAAEAYKAKMSPHLQWMEEEDVILEGAARTNAHLTWRSYKEWVKDDNPLHRETKAEFRDALTAATKGAVTYGRFGDEWVFFGMRFKKASAGKNVVPFPPIGAVKDVHLAAGEDAKIEADVKTDAKPV